jgi:hypothetical protein
VTNRREFLQAAAVLSAVPLVGRVALAGSGVAGAGAAAGDAVALDAVVFDSRHAESRDFGARAGRLGVPLRAIAGDITDLWQQELRLRLKAGSLVIGGLTERPALFLLERLAWDHRLRVVFEVEHEPDGRGGAAHRVVRTADPNLARVLESAGRAWPATLAEALIDATRLPAPDVRPTDPGLAARLGEPMTLYSWIIAPRRAASHTGSS